MILRPTNVVLQPGAIRVWLQTDDVAFCKLVDYNTQHRGGVNYNFEPDLPALPEVKVDAVSKGTSTLST